jgi:uncharacterized protein YjbI with pentapeptide repeats
MIQPTVRLSAGPGGASSDARSGQRLGQSSHMSANQYQVPLEVYARLDDATPQERTDIALQLIEEHPEGQLELPERDGIRANLQGIDLSHVTLEARLTEYEGGAPAWWQIRHNCAALEGADLRGAVLSEANLQAACLWGANLEDAELTETNLQGADLWRANLQGAALGGADLQEAVLKSADLRKSFLWEANFAGAVLQGADLRDAECEDTNLRNADLRNARLQEVSLSTCDLRHIYVSGTWLQRTRLRYQQLGGAIGEELAGDFEAARQGYLTLKHNFDSLGDYRAASWAHSRERRMEKEHERLQARTAAAEHAWQLAIVRYARLAAYQGVEWLCDYGESILRLIVSLVVLVCFFTAVYAITGGVVRIEQTPAGAVTRPTRDPVELLLFSLGTITRMSPIDLETRGHLTGLIAGLEAFLGIALTGLLGFVVGYRIRRG